MSAYVPSELSVVIIVLASLPMILIVGWFVANVRSVVLARLLAWSIVIASVAAFEWYTIGSPAGFRMLAIIGVLLFTMKIVVVSEVHLAGKVRLSFLQWIGFAGLWVGMRPALFANVPRASRSNVAMYVSRGLLNLSIGFAFVIAARVVWSVTDDWSRGSRLLFATVLLLPGLSLMLHFGLFNLLTAAWRAMGAECDSVFRAPLLSKSLAEFWGRRWNLAFSEMTTLAVFRPLRAAFGNTFATLAAFLFSGVLHELAISVPVRAGFGGPLLYFAAHGFGMLLESRWASLAELIQTRPAFGRAWTLTWIVLPLPVLFHEPFLRGCVWPLIGIEP